MMRLGALTVSATLLGCLLAPGTAGGAAPPDRLWKARCASCHGASGKGDTLQGKQLAVPDFRSAAWQKQRTDAALRTAIERGTPSAVAKQVDHAFASKLTAAQIDALVRFIRTLAR